MENPQTGLQTIHNILSLVPHHCHTYRFFPSSRGKFYRSSHHLVIESNYTPIIQSLEDGIVHGISQYSIPALTYFFVFMYIVLYPFTLWFTLLYFILTDQRKAMKTFALCFSFIYGIALPFYLFVPITNVSTYYGTTLTLNTVFPGIERFFYATTTSNNCFPSLHVAMTLLVAQTISLTTNKRYKYFAYFCAIGVIISVIYLAIHWITDVVGGILLSFAAFYLVKRFTKER
jgi:membrane-associated phospholipid phosphatase